MLLSKWLETSKKKLIYSGISSASLDSEILLADSLGKDRSWIHAHPDYSLSEENMELLNTQIARRARHEPVAYILGKKEFYGREFLVTSDALTPRPETETMVEVLLQQTGDWRLEIGESTQIVDVGTGSECIIITAALELSSNISSPSSISYVGLDISNEALKIAKQNAEKFHVKVNFQYFDLTKDSLFSVLNPHSTICILANLPYVPDNYKINEAAKHEPGVALFGGEDGLDYYRRLFEELSSEPKTKNGHTIVLTESLEFQHEKMKNIANRHGFKLHKSKDLIQCFKRT